MTNPPADLAQLLPWLSAIRQLRQVGKSRGLSIVTFKVLVDECGNPLQWSRPRQTELSPLSQNNDFGDLMRQLCADSPAAADRLLDALS